MKTSSLRSRGVVAAMCASAIGVLCFIGWSASAQPQNASQPKFLPLRITTNEMMVAMVDDVAHNIWDGGNKQTRLTDNEWLVVDEHSVQLRALATLISLGGSGEPDHGWAVSPAWQDWSSKLREVGVTVKSAADAKDQIALRKAGDELVTVCEGCHKVFKPDLPTEGILHKGHGHF